MIELLLWMSSRTLLVAPTPETSLLRLLLLIVIAGAVILLVSAALLALMRIQRRRWTRLRSQGEGRVRSSMKDAWAEASQRVPFEEDAPHERNPDDDLPPLTGRPK